jgi:hypothetical protein
MEFSIPNKGYLIALHLFFLQNKKIGNIKTVTETVTKIKIIANLEFSTDT